MPFIVTTKRTDDLSGLSEVSRRAVATLEEARADIIKRHNTFGAVHRMTESGGSVGPLPDGTVVEVGPANWSDLSGVVYAPHGGLLIAGAAADGSRLWQGRLVAAYNAKQAGHAE